MLLQNYCAIEYGSGYRKLMNGDEVTFHSILDSGKMLVRRMMSFMRYLLSSVLENARVIGFSLKAILFRAR